jgi:hypothetical protein
MKNSSAMISCESTKLSLGKSNNNYSIEVRQQSFDIYIYWGKVIVINCQD